jgi:hypothetical protein
LLVPASNENGNRQRQPGPPAPLGFRLSPVYTDIHGRSTVSKHISGHISGDLAFKLEGKSYAAASETAKPGRKPKLPRIVFALYSLCIDGH